MIMAASTCFLQYPSLVSRSADGLLNRCLRTTYIATRRFSDRLPSIQEKRRKDRNVSGHVNCASLERGVTKYFCNRNPRSLELLGIADKPLGFATKNQRMDYYHR